MEVEAKRKSAKAQHRKELMDPLLSMQHYVEVKKKSEGLSGKESECESRRHSHPIQVIPQTNTELMFQWVYSCERELHWVYFS